MRFAPLRVFSIAIVAAAFLAVPGGAHAGPDKKPINLTAPTISGYAIEGEQLTADPGTWQVTQDPEYAYQWFRCKASCTAIAFANATTYVLASDDAGSTIKVQVTAFGKDEDTTALSDPTDVVEFATPVLVGDVTIAGTAVDGHTLTVEVGAVTSSTPVTKTYQWQRCVEGGVEPERRGLATALQGKLKCANIVGATSATYVLGVVDIGASLRVTVNLYNAAAYPAVFGTDFVGPVVGAAPVSVTAPAVIGDAKVGSTLTATPGVWTGTLPVTFAFQWQRCSSNDTCADIAGATARTYAVGAADAGAFVRVVVTATNGFGMLAAHSAVSKAVTTTTVVTPPITAPPTATPPTATPPKLDASVGTTTGGSTDSSSTVTVSASDDVKVACTLSGAEIESCDVKVYYGPRVRRAKRSRILVATGKAIQSKDGTGSLSVTTELTAAGKQLVESHPEGLKTTFEINAKPVGSAAALTSIKSATLYARTQVLAPKFAMFGPDSSTLTTDGMKWLKSQATYLKGAAKVTCTGYTAQPEGRTPNPVAALALGLARAQAACHYLKLLHVKVKTDVKSEGNTAPRGNNHTPSGRELNRFVSLTVVRK